MVLETGQTTVKDRPWTAFYGDMPGEIDYPDTTLYGVLRESAGAAPRQAVYDFLGHRRSFRSLLSEVKRIARGLWNLGVRPGHRVCTLLPNAPHLMILLYATNRIGATLAILDADAGARDVRHYLEELKPQWAVVTDEHLEAFQRLCTGKGIRGVVVAFLTDYASTGRVKSLHRFRRRQGLSEGGLRGPAGVRPSSEEAAELYELPPVFSWQSMRKLGIRSAALEDQSALHTPDQCAVVLFTGGTVGTPSGVMLSDRNLDAAARQLLLQGPIIPGQKLLSVVPFSHGLGLSVSIHTAVAASAESIVVPYFTRRSIVRTIRRCRPEYLIGVPSFYAALLSDRRFQRMRLAFLMGAFGGGERISAHLRDRFEMTVRRRGGAIQIREGYGLTETVAACAIMPESVMRAGSVGVPMPDTDVRIVRAGTADDELEDVPTGDTGEICVSGPTVMLGYLTDSGNGRIVDSEEGRWFRTRDLGYMDADGFLYFVDRIGRAVGSDGVIIHPGLVEDALNMHPEVKHACVLARSDGGNTYLTAHIVPIDGDLDTEWMETTLRSWCENELPDVLQPRTFIFCSELPRTRIGFVDYRKVEASVSAAHV